MKKITQQDIANALGISRLTVSKALNNQPGVRKEMRNLILQKASELKYRGLNSAAVVRPDHVIEDIQNTSSPTRTKIVTLLTYQHGYVGNYWDQVINGIMNILVHKGFDLNMCLVQSSNGDNIQIPQNFNASESSGIIVFGYFNKNHIKQIMSLNLPVVCIDTAADIDDNDWLTDTVILCNAEPIYQITEQLIKNGHTKIGFIGDIGDRKSFRERWNGYQQAMKHYGIPVNQEYCYILDGAGNPRNFDLQDAIIKMKELPTAFVCENDYTAATLVQLLHRLGKQVPEDICVSGFDNLFEAQLFGLTTVESHRVKLGERAAMEMLMRIENPDEPRVVVRMATNVVFRESTNRILSQK